MSSTQPQTKQQQGVSAQRFDNSQGQTGAGVSTIPYASSVSLNVDSALQLFSEGQLLCLNANNTLAGTPEKIGVLDLCISLRKEIDDLNFRLAQKSSAFMVNHDWNQYGRTNEEWRDAKIMTELSEDEEYSAWHDEREEKEAEYRTAQNLAVVCTNQISIGKRQMDFAAALIHGIASGNPQSIGGPSVNR